MARASERRVPPFPESARAALGDSQLRHNLRNATETIRAKRGRATAELPDWQALREAGAAIKTRTLRHLDVYLLELERSVQRVGGRVHWADTAEAANQVVAGLAKQRGVPFVIKVKSMTTEETGLNGALAAAGIEAIETDLAELIIQLAGEHSSHILVPAIHKNRGEIRDLFRRHLGLAALSDDPAELTAAARRFLREKFLTATMGVSGANFAVAETGSVCVVESEGNGRMCLTLPKVLVTVMGIEKVIPGWQDLEVFLQTLPRSATAERMNPYTSLWTGVHQGDGPQEFHLVLLDNGRSEVLADEIGRQTLRCIRCSACLNVCPVYERVGGHAYRSVYPGPIGAVLTPQLRGLREAGSLPFASTLCGACYEVCPVEIDIPRVLVHLRGRAVQERPAGTPRAEDLLMRVAARALADARRYERAQRLARTAQGLFARDGFVERLPGYLSGWTAMRDLKAVPAQTFREWWRKR